MIFGMTPVLFVHLLISLIGIVTGLIVLFGMPNNDRMNGMTLVFLLFTAATTITGFILPLNGLTPPVILGIISLVVLVPTFAARYAFGMRGAWRWVYILGATIALYLNFFVLVVQSFLKIPVLNALAPTGSEPPFAIMQGVVLLFFFVTGYLAVKRFRPV